MDLETCLHLDITPLTGGCDNSTCYRQTSLGKCLLRISHPDCKTLASLLGDLLNPGHLCLVSRAEAGLELGLMNLFWFPGTITSFSRAFQITPLILLSPQSNV